MEQSIISFCNDYCFFLGSVNNVKKHHHFALQICIPIHKKLTVIEDDSIKKSYPSCVIKSEVPHKLLSKDAHLMIFFDPYSSYGLIFNDTFKPDIYELDTSLAKNLKKVVSNYYSKRISSNDLSKKIRLLLNNFKNKNNHHINLDPRIIKALHHLKNSNEEITLSDISSICNLSKSQCSRIFKKEIGVTFKRIKFWYKIVKTLKLFPKTDGKLLESAQINGFIDNSHFSNAFKRSFGISPKKIFKNSILIQEK